MPLTPPARLLRTIYTASQNHFTMVQSSSSYYASSEYIRVNTVKLGIQANAYLLRKYESSPTSSKQKPFLPWVNSVEATTHHLKISRSSPLHTVKTGYKRQSKNIGSSVSSRLTTPIQERPDCSILQRPESYRVRK